MGGAARVGLAPAHPVRDRPPSVSEVVLPVRSPQRLVGAQGTVPMWTRIGDEGATAFSYQGMASPQSIADAADSLDAVGNGAQLPPEAANHDVDGVAATVVARAPYLAE